MTNRPRTAIRFSEEIILQLEQILDNPPEPPEQAALSRSEVVKRLKNKILTLKEKGYSYAQICRMLASANFDIAEPTIKTYLNEGENKPKKSAKIQPKSKTSKSSGKQIEISNSNITTSGIKQTDANSDDSDTKEVTVSTEPSSNPVTRTETEVTKPKTGKFTMSPD